MTAFSFVRNGAADSIVFDATISESHTHDADVTENPVETGSAITDNVRAKPAQLKIETLITDYSITARGNGIGAAPEAGRAQKVFDLLTLLKDEGIRIEVTTSARSYTGMVIRSVTVPRDKAIAGALRFSIQMIEIRTVSSETTSVSLTVTDRKAQAKKQDGDKTGTPTDAATAKKSVFARVADSATPDGLKKVINGSFSGLIR